MERHLDYNWRRWLVWPRWRYTGTVCRQQPFSRLGTSKQAGRHGPERRNYYDDFFFHWSLHTHSIKYVRWWSKRKRYVHPCEFYSFPFPIITSSSSRIRSKKKKKKNCCNINSWQSCCCFNFPFAIRLLKNFNLSAFSWQGNRPS